MRHVVALLCLLTGAGLQIQSASAGQQDFKLDNRTGYQIDEVYVSRSSSRNWGSDVMGSDALEDGHAVDISFNAPDSACQWDMKVKYSDGDEATWNSLNLCHINKVTLYWDRKKEVTRAVTE